MFLPQTLQSILHLSTNSCRIQSTARQEKTFKRRYAWCVIKVAMLLLIVWAYGMFGTAFANIPQEYQWILGLLSPFAKYICLKPLSEIVFKSAGEGSREKYAIRIPVMHYMTTKHAVFLAVIVGNVADTLTTYCIIATDFAITLFQALKIICNHRFGKSVEGKPISL